MEGINPQHNKTNRQADRTRRSTHHLGLTADHFSPTIILAENASWIPVIAQYFDTILHKAQCQHFSSIKGQLAGKEVLLAGPCFSAAEADIILHELYEHIDRGAGGRPVCVFRLGTATALRSDVGLDSKIVSSYSIGLDNLVHYYRHENNTEERFIADAFLQHARITPGQVQPYVAQGAINLVKHFGPGYTHGITASMPGFYTPLYPNNRGQLVQPYLADALASFNSRNMNLIASDQGTAAVYGLGKIMGMHCCSISLVTNNTPLRTTTVGGTAAAMMIADIITLIAQIP